MITPATVVNLADFEALAREQLDAGTHDFFAGGAEDEQTLAENREGFARLLLRPRVLVDVTSVDTSTQLLGTHLRIPVLLAPTALNRLAHPDGELATARAAADCESLLVVSTNASVTLEHIARETAAPLWFQLYVHRDRALTSDLIARVEANGYRALMLTVDTPRLGRRERDLRNQFALPAHVTTVNLGRLELAPEVVPTRRQGYHEEVANQFDSSLTWDVIDWLRSQTRLPILIKGILSPADAGLAVAAGVAGIAVSNHGGRQLDGAMATIDALPEIVDVVAGRVPILLDGGVRRGTDVIKALALGASAVMIGRPYLWALAAAGEHGVRRVFDLLRNEFETAMALCGCPAVGAITRALVAHRTCGAHGPAVRPSSR